ncbi:MAG: HD domain-containing protein [Betaproteobacteria bacterium]
MDIRFTRLADGTTEEYRYLEALDHGLNRSYPDDLLAMFRDTDRETGYPLTAMRHALQTATRAHRDGADDEMVFAALFHDVADRVSPINHAAVGAEILRPFIGPRTHWILAHHAIFQGHYYWHHIGKDRDARDRFRGHPHFDPCAQFCERWDSISFDPGYDTMPLDEFMPMVRRVLGREPNALWRQQEGEP